MPKTDHHGTKSMLRCDPYGLINFPDFDFKVPRRRFKVSSVARKHLKDLSQASMLT